MIISCDYASFLSVKFLLCYMIINLNRFEQGTSRVDSGSIFTSIDISN